MALRCSGVNPPMYLPVYLIPCSAIASGMAVMAAFCRSPRPSAGQSVAGVVEQLDDRAWLAGSVAGPKEMGCSPKPCGTMSATETSPALTAASAVAAV